MNNELLIHLIELRKRLIYILSGILIVFLGLFHFANTIYTIASQPLLIYLPHGTQLIATDITSPFFAPLKLTAYVAIFLSLPNTAYQIWKFIAPGLYLHEQKLIILSVLSVVILAVLGMLFCYFIVLPTLFNFIGHIKSQEITMLTDITKYLDFILNLFLVFAIAFQTPVLIFLLIYFGVVKHSKMASLRKYILVGCFIIAAIVTPPDVLSQTMLAIPLYLFYEIGMFVAKICTRTQELK